MARIVTYTILVEFEDETKDVEIDAFQCLLENEINKAGYGFADGFWESDDEELTEEKGENDE